MVPIPLIAWNQLSIATKHLMELNMIEMIKLMKLETNQRIKSRCIDGKRVQKYKIPHLKKGVLLTQGELPTQLKCDPELVRKVFE